MYCIINIIVMPPFSSFLSPTKHITIPLYTTTEARGLGDSSRASHNHSGLGRAWLHGPTVWIPGQTDLVGVLMGHHGACYLFCHLWHCDGSVCLLCGDSAGECVRVYGGVVRGDSFLPRSSSFIWGVIFLFSIILSNLSFPHSSRDRSTFPRFTNQLPK